MRFSLVSDLHVDFPQPRIQYDLLEENVIVAGDTSNGLEGLRFLQKLRNKGFNVYAVDGNHEHYGNLSQGRTEKETTARFREEHKRRHETTIPIVLANGWYQVTNEALWNSYMSDSRRSLLSATDVNTLAVNDAAFIRQTLNEWRDYQVTGIVVTHTAPCMDTLSPRFEGHYSNEWYWNPLMEPLLEEYRDHIYVWCHGHTHDAADKIVHGVRVVCNPRGYPGENPDWKPLTIDLNKA